MWVARFKLKHEMDIFTERTSKFGVDFYAYPVTHYKKGNSILFVAMGFLEGEEKAKDSFVSALKKDSRIKQIDRKGDYLAILIHYPNTEIVQADLKTFYDPAIIHTEPVLNSRDGWEYWTVASFEKENLKQVIDSAAALHNGKLLSMQNRKLEDFYIINIKPKISKKQKEAIQTAFKEGYYTYPRKTDILKLAKILKISYATCQEHLRKAEIALLPSMIKKL